MMQVNEMTDLEFVDHWIERCSDFINPILFKELQNRGLCHVTNLLTGNIEERKAQARARMASTGHYIGEPEIEDIASTIDTIKRLQRKIAQCDPTDFNVLINLTDALGSHLKYLKNYLK